MYSLPYLKPIVRYLACLFGSVIFMLSLPITPLQASHQLYPRLGVNVEGIHQFKTSRPFINLFKISQGWFTSCEFDWLANKPVDPGCTRSNAFNTREQDKLKLDKNGWVRALPAREDDEIFTSVVSGLHLDSDFPLGRYVLLYAGEGDIQVSGALNIIDDEEPGRIEFDLIATQRGLKIKISRVHARNYIRNIRLVTVENEKQLARQLFDPLYLEKLRPFDAIRFMPWINPRRNQQVEWEQRPLPEFAHYTGDQGVPVEVMLDLAQRTDAAPWLTIPHKANDDFVRRFARLVKKTLKGHGKIYVEYSNEMWNIIFPANSYAVRQALSLWPTAYRNSSDYERRVKLASNWYGKRSVEICRIWKEVFGRQKHRVICVLAAQSSVDWVGQQVLDCPLWFEGPCGAGVDAYAVGPYFGDYIAKIEHRERVKKWAERDDGLDQLFREIEQGGMLENGPEGGAIQHFVETALKTSMRLADDYGLPLLAYEAGQHLIRYDPPHRITTPSVLNFFMRANQDPRMEHAYQRYLQAWEENGGKTLMHFYGIGKPSPHDFFAMLPSSRSETSPKYKALLDYLQHRGYQDKYAHHLPLSMKVLQARRQEARKKSREPSPGY